MKPLDAAGLPRSIAAFLLGCATLAVLTSIAFSLHFSLAPVSLLYVVVVVLASLTGNIVLSVALALLAGACLAYFFARPIFSLAVDAPEDIVTIIVFVSISVLVGSLVKRVRRLGEAAARHEADARLREAQAELAHVNRLTTAGQLAASIGHEVAQPVTAALTNANAALRWLSTTPPDLEEAREALNRIVRDGRRASDIIDRIRALVRKEPPRREPFDLNQMILEVIALMRTELRRNEISPRTRLTDGLPPVRGDRIQLQQVMLNLILNAVEAMSGSSEASRDLLITTEQDDANTVHIAVRDSGSGLSSESVPHLFNAFYTTKSDGMGMGLSICRSIIEAHGGRVWATANEPRGAVFQFTLPREKAGLQRT